MTALEPPRRLYSQRFQQFDLPVLRFVGTSGLAYSGTVLRRFWVYDARHPGHGTRVLARLVKQGLVTSHKLRPHLGQRSPCALALTRAGYAEAALELPRRDPWDASEDERWWRCQWADVLTVFEAAAWRLLEGPLAFEALRSAARQVMRAPGVQRANAQLLERIERAPVRPLPVPVLYQPARQEARLILHAHRGRRARTTLKRLPDLRVFGTLHIQLVTPWPSVAEEVPQVLARWARRSRQEFDLHVPPFFRDRGRARDDEVQAVSRYEASGAPPVSTMR